MPEAKKNTDFEQKMETESIWKEWDSLVSLHI